jgi:hypothetical protein
MATSWNMASDGVKENQLFSHTAQVLYSTGTLYYYPKKESLASWHFNRSYNQYLASILLLCHACLNDSYISSSTHGTLFQNHLVWARDSATKHATQIRRAFISVVAAAALEQTFSQTVAVALFEATVTVEVAFQLRQLVNHIPTEPNPRLHSNQALDTKVTRDRHPQDPLVHDLPSSGCKYTTLSFSRAWSSCSNKC